MKLPLDDLQARIDELAPALDEAGALEIVDITPVVRAGQWSQLDSIWEHAERRLRDVLSRLAPNRLRSLTLSTAAVADGDYEIDCQRATVQYYGGSFVRMASELPSLANLRELVIHDSGLRREAIADLARWKNLEVLRLGRAALGEKGLAELRAALPNTTLDILSTAD